MPVGGRGYGLRDGDQKTRAPLQGDKTSQRLKRCSVQQMEQNSRRFDERMDYMFQRFDERFGVIEEHLYACTQTHRRQSVDRRPRVDIAHGCPIGSSVPVRRQYVYDDVLEEKYDFDRVNHYQSYEGHVKRNGCEDVKVEDVTQEHQLFHTRCTINGKVCKLIIDGDKEENIIGRNIVDKLQLPVEKHPNPYSIGWIKVGEMIQVTERCKVPFSISKYKDEVYCDVVNLNACHILFGKPWRYGVKAQHVKKDNTYKLEKEGVKYILIPLRVNKSPNTPKVKEQFDISKTHFEQKMEVAMKESKDVNVEVEENDEKLETAHEDTCEKYEVEATTDKSKEVSHLVDMKIDNESIKCLNLVERGDQILDVKDDKKLIMNDNVKLVHMFDPIGDYLEELVDSKLVGCVTKFEIGIIPIINFYGRFDQNGGEKEFFRSTTWFVFFNRMICASFYGDKVRITRRRIIIWKRVRLKIERQVQNLKPHSMGSTSINIFRKLEDEFFFKWRRMTRSQLWKKSWVDSTKKYWSKKLYKILKLQKV